MYAGKAVRQRRVSLRMVVPGVGFRGGTLYRPEYWWRPKKKGSSLQNELVFNPKVCDDQKQNKKKVFAYQSLGFQSQKKKKQTVSPQNGDTPGRAAPPSNATAPAHLISV